MCMLRKTWRLVTLVLVLVTCTTQRKPTDLDREHLKGRVLSYTETYFDALKENGEYVKQGHDDLSVQKVYHRKGMLVEINHLDDGTVKEAQIFYFDEQGNKLRKTHHIGDRHINTVQYVYNYQGKIIEELTLNPEDGIRFTREAFFYNKKGQVVEELSFLEDDRDTTRKVIYTYDQNNLLVEEHTHFKHSSSQYRTFTYNAHNFLEKVVISEPNMIDRVFRFSYEYDAQGNWTKRYQEVDNTPEVVIVERTYKYYPE